MPKSITQPALRKTDPDRPTKPRPDFPLFPHATGRWAKKIHGKFHYFGYMHDDPRGEAALALWNDMLAGRTPRAKAEGLTLRELCDRFMVRCHRKMDADELTAASFRDYYDTCKRVIGFFGATRLVTDLAADDFEPFRASMAKAWGPVTLANEITRVRVVFKYAAATATATSKKCRPRLSTWRPVGPSFPGRKRPS